MLGVRNRRLMGKMARESRCYRRQQGAAESGVGYAGRKGLDRESGCGTSEFALVARPGRLCTPVECTRMAKSVGIRGDRWGDGAKGLVDRKGNVSVFLRLLGEWTDECLHILPPLPQESLLCF